MAKIDAMVDDDPQVAVIEKGISDSGLHVLNRTLLGFQYDCPEITAIKTKLEGIEEKRTETFHLLLDGSEEVKRKLDDTLKDYQNAKKSKKAKAGASGTGHSAGSGSEGQVAS